MSGRTDETRQLLRSPQPAAQCRTEAEHKKIDAASQKMLDAGVMR
jgi:hypothetical protein